MKRFVLIIVILFFVPSLVLAQAAQEAQSQADLQSLSATIHSELEVHGERAVGHDMYHWSTRLEKMSNCRVEFSVRITSKLADEMVRREDVSFSLGALEPDGVEIQKNWLQLPCASGDKCILSTSSCTRKTKEGLVIDCTTTNQPRADAFALELDGDAAALARLEKAFRRAVDLCREPVSVTF